MAAEWNSQAGYVVWFTGPSGSGKTTVALALERQLRKQGTPSFVLDGDKLRESLNASSDQLRKSHNETFARRFGLGFSPEDREENVRRVGAVARLFCDAGLIPIVALISPYRSERNRVRNHFPSGRFVEVFMSTPLETCEARDPKGLYQKARAGLLEGFTGVNAPYEPPWEAEVTLDASRESPEALAGRIVLFLKEKGLLTAVDIAGS